MDPAIIATFAKESILGSVILASWAIIIRLYLDGKAKDKRYEDLMDKRVAESRESIMALNQVANQTTASVQSLVEIVKARRE